MLFIDSSSGHVRWTCFQDGDGVNDISPLKAAAKEAQAFWDGCRVEELVDGRVMRLTTIQVEGRMINLEQPVVPFESSDDGAHVTDGAVPPIEGLVPGAGPAMVVVEPAVQLVTTPQHATSLQVPATSSPNDSKDTSPSGTSLGRVSCLPLEQLLVPLRAHYAGYFAKVALLVIPAIERHLFHIAYGEGTANGAGVGFGSDKVGSSRDIEGSNGDLASYQRTTLLNHLLEHNTTLHAAIGPGAVTFFQLLFFPVHDGLNLRNLVWHGFLDDEDIGPHYSALIISAWVTLCHEHASPDDRDPRVLGLLRSLQEFVAHEGMSEYTQLAAQLACDPTWAKAPNEFLHPRRVPVLERSLAEYRAGRFREFLHVAVPMVVEHGMRYLYCSANGSMDKCVAQKGQYFTTLDGYGQRDRHDVILARVRMDGQYNTLFGRMPKGLLNLLMDMFMLQEGPSIRAHVAHGYVGLTSVKDEDQMIEYCSAMLLVTIAALHRFAAPCPQASSITELALNLTASWKLRFHPNTLLESAMNDCLASLRSLREFARHTTHFTPALDDVERFFTIEYQGQPVDLPAGTVMKHAAFEKLVGDMSRLRDTLERNMARASDTTLHLWSSQAADSVSLNQDVDTDVIPNYKEVRHVFQHTDNLCKALRSELEKLLQSVVGRTARSSKRKKLVRLLACVDTILDALLCVCCFSHDVVLASGVLRENGKKYWTRLVLGYQSFCVSLEGMHGQVAAVHNKQKGDIATVVRKFVALVDT